MNHGERPPHVDDRRGSVWPREGWAQAALVPNIISDKFCGRILARMYSDMYTPVHRSEETPKHEFTFLEMEKLSQCGSINHP